MSVDIPSRQAFRAHADLAWRVLDAELSGGPDVDLAPDEVASEVQFCQQIQVIRASAGYPTYPVVPCWPGVARELPVILHDDGSATIRVNL